MSDDTTQQLLEKAHAAATGWSGEHRGMASVGVRWHPYECGWEAFANWSDNTEVRAAVSHDAADSLMELIGTLESLRAYARDNVMAKENAPDVP